MTLQKFAITDTMSLDDWGTVRDPLTLPACQVRGKSHLEDANGTLKAGVWECTPGRFRRALFDNEFMHILSGECTFTPEGGEAIVLREGDSFTLTADIQGIWEVRTTVRKLYAVFTARDRAA
jgi:uncharacterized cupin superfamily protein